MENYSTETSKWQSTNSEKEVAWEPDLIGPIFKNSFVGLREVLFTHQSDKCIRTLATFVPDELIYETDISRKNFRKFNAVLALIDVSRIFGLYQNFMNAENGGSYKLIDMLNGIIGSIIEEVYYSGGDVFKLSIDSLLVLWRIGDDGFFSTMVNNVILYAQKIQTIVEALDTLIPVPKIEIVVSAGEVIFSVIGHKKTRDFLIAGPPVMDLKFSRRICFSGDLVLATSAWEHCAPNQYEYVIKGSNNVKIIRALDVQSKSISMATRRESLQPSVSSSVDSSVRPSYLSKPNSEGDASAEGDDVADSDVENKFSSARSHPSANSDARRQATRVSMIEMLKQHLGKHLEVYMLNPVLYQIKKEVPLRQLTKIKRVTVTCVNIIPNQCTVYELISLVDELFMVLLKYVHSVDES